MAKCPLPSVKEVKTNSHLQVMCHFNFFSSIFAFTSDRENDAYTLLNPNPTHEKNFEVRAKVEQKKIKLHVTVGRQF